MGLTLIWREKKCNDWYLFRQFLCTILVNLVITCINHNFWLFCWYRIFSSYINIIIWLKTHKPCVWSWGFKLYALTIRHSKRRRKNTNGTSIWVFLRGVVKERWLAQIENKIWLRIRSMDWFANQKPRKSSIMHIDWCTLGRSHMEKIKYGWPWTSGQGESFISEIYSDVSSRSCLINRGSG